MKEIIVVGSGKMGVAITYALFKLGYHIHLVDVNRESLKNAVTFLQSLDVHISSAGWSLNNLKRKPIKTMISAAPYFVNIEYAHKCLQHQWLYCDLGGSPDNTEKINSLFTKHKQGCITDLGLAPGLVNIIAEHGIRECQSPHSVFLKVGGLPIRQQNKYGYNEVFSLEGLWNEYTGESEVLQDGNPKKLSTLTEIENVNFGDMEFEAFHTRGALSYTLKSMQEKSIKHCNYKTLRFKGHLDLIKPLIEKGNKEFFNEIKQHCPLTKEDQVLIDVTILDNVGIWQKQSIIKHDEAWTAMQKTTAFPAGAVASLLDNGDLPHDRPSQYQDIPIDKLRSGLKIIDGNQFEELF